MIYHDIAELPPAEEQVVITNISTKIVTTLALLSALKYAEMPVLILDCESNDGSFEYFSKLMKTFKFDLLSAPLKEPGTNLDWLFSQVPIQKVLLLDSDAELLNSEIVKLAHEYIDDENTFGFGFIDGPCWWEQHEVVRMFPEQALSEPPRGYYEERPWLPFTILKTSMIQEALQAGRSFYMRRLCNDFAPSQLISRMLLRRYMLKRYLLERYHVSIFRNSDLSWLNPFKQSFHGHKPSWILYDCGADVYEYLKYQKNYDFVGFPARFHSRYVSHLWGVSRLVADQSDTPGTPLNNAQDIARKRLKEVYGFSPERLIS